MNCPRCKRKMAYNKFYGIGDSHFSWHCLCCGEILDSVILQNRKKSLPIYEQHQRNRAEKPRIGLVE